jgi:hypothetical protein
MVRNRRDEPGWWDDLPPRIRERFSPQPTEWSEPVAVAEAPVPRRSLAWLRDSSLFALVMFGIALANLFFLLLVFALVDRPAPVN